MASARRGTEVGSHGVSVSRSFLRARRLQLRSWCLYSCTSMAHCLHVSLLGSSLRFPPVAAAPSTGAP
jgi:hypothetical protein